MKIYVIAPEVDPFAKTGGLADVAAALPKALSALGHDARIVMPLYQQVKRKALGLRPTDLTLSIKAGPKTWEVRIWDAVLPNTRVPIWFIECAPLFHREGLYQVAGKDHPDNLTRFSVFAQAALRLLPAIPWQPDVIHCHDWQSALACAQLRFGAMSHEPFFSSIGTAFTIHNLAYQGLFPHDQWAVTSLPDAAFGIEGLEFYGQINCLKGGLVCAEALTTVSPTYAKEIRTPAFGCGLEGVLNARGEALSGIVNGIDPDEWNPATDPHTAAPYSADQVAGKALCKLALQRSQRLSERHDLLLGMIQRLAEQKGIDILIQAMDELMALPVQLVLLGTGDPVYHQQLQELVKRFPNRLAVSLTFDNALAHQIEAGADAFLMPSRFEPCGLNQMYSMRFGTVPIVKRVGGLADTVVDVSPSTLADGTATGFVFADHTAKALVDAVKRAVGAFGDHGLWARLMQHGMRGDFSWAHSAQTYLKVYERAIARPRAVAVSR